MIDDEKKATEPPKDQSPKPEEGEAVDVYGKAPEMIDRDEVYVH